MEIRTLGNGSLIRAERIRRGMGQKELACDICTVSYLSRIENEEVIPHTALTSHLMEKLGYRELEKDREEYLKSRLERLFTSYLSNHTSYMKDKMLQSELEELAHTRLFLYGKLALFIVDDVTDDILESSFSMLPADIQSIYCINASYTKEGVNHTEKAIIWAEKAVALYPSAAAYIALANAQFQSGRIGLMEASLDMAEKHALRAGLLSMLPLAAMYRAMRESFLPTEHTLELYDTALRMAEALNDEELISDICYNAGSTAFEIAEYSKAEKFLNRCNTSLSLYYHKRCMLEILKGEYEKAEEYLSLFKKSSCDEEKKSIFSTLLELRIRYKEKYLKQKETLDTLEKLYDYSRKNVHFGFMFTYGRELIECLKQQRLYMRALEVEEELFTNTPLKLV